MEKIIGILSLVLILTTGALANQEMVLEGTYQGENLYVQNPFASSGVGFCVTNVLINGQQSIDEINSSAFEIDFSSYQLSKGASVKVKIEYKDDCTPRVLNPEVLKPSSTDAESTSTFCDFVSNGFKVRQSFATSVDFFYMAFAEHPLVSSNDVPATAR